MSTEFFPNSDSRLAEFQSHLIPPDLQFYPYLDISWRIDDDIPTTETWAQSTAPTTEVWIETTNETDNPWGESEESSEGIWTESDSPEITTWIEI